LRNTPVRQDRTEKAVVVTPEDLSTFINNVIVRFSGIFFEALPWVILGSILAGIVQELPTRRSPVFMVPLGLLILILTISPLAMLARQNPNGPLSWVLATNGSQSLAGWATNLCIAVVIALAAGFALHRGQNTTDLVLRTLGRRRGLAIVMSALLGLIIPMCECGIITVMRRLHRKGMPLSCCTAYILAGPIINVVVLLTTYVAFYNQLPATTVVGADGQPHTIFHLTAGWMVLGRGLGGFIVALGAAFLVEWQVRRSGAESLLAADFRVSKNPVKENETGKEPERSLYERLSNISETAVHDILDITFYLVVGGLLAAGIKEGLEYGGIGQKTVSGKPWLAIGGMMLLAFLVTLCSEADAFVAFTFTQLGPAPKLAFLVLGPMLDLKLVLMYTRVFRPKLMAIIILAIVVQVFVLMNLFELAWSDLAPRLIPAPK
jgi:uncharacterized membrane protein YraQ (UPF0718 family)